MRKNSLVVLLIVIMSFGLFAADAICEQPVGVVTICFDDAQQNVFPIAFPKLDNYTIKANLYVISGSILDRPSWHLSWEQIQVLAKSGWEIGSHSNTHPYLTKVDVDKLDEELALSKKILEDHGFNIRSFATPYGDFNEQVLSEIRKYYQSHRGIEIPPAGTPEKSLNDLNVDPYQISAIGLRYEQNFEFVKKLIDEAVEEKKWAIFYLHGVTEEHPFPTDYQYDAGELGKIAAYLDKLRHAGVLRVMTISEYLAVRAKPIEKH